VLAPLGVFRLGPEPCNSNSTVIKTSSEIDISLLVGFRSLQPINCCWADGVVCHVKTVLSAGPAGAAATRAHCSRGSGALQAVAADCPAGAVLQDGEGGCGAGATGSPRLAACNRQHVGHNSLQSGLQSGRMRVPLLLKRVQFVVEVCCLDSISTMALPGWACSGLMEWVWYTSCAAAHALRGTYMAAARSGVCVAYRPLSRLD